MSLIDRLPSTKLPSSGTMAIEVLELQKRRGRLDGFGAHRSRRARARGDPRRRGRGCARPAARTASCVMPMLVQTLVMPFSMSSEPAVQHRVDRCRHESLERSHPPLLAIDRLAEHDQHVAAGTLLIAHLRDGLAAIFSQPRMRANSEVREQRFRIRVGQRGQEIRRRGRGERCTVARHALVVTMRRSGNAEGIERQLADILERPRIDDRTAWRANNSTTSSPIQAVDHRPRTTCKGLSLGLSDMNGGLGGGDRRRRSPRQRESIG